MGRVEKIRDCAMIALKRGQNVELSIISGMLHDIYSFKTLDSKDHAHKGAVMARDILTDLEIFTEEEKNMVCNAIYNHSSKGGTYPPLMRF